MEVSEFKSINDITSIFPNVKIKKMSEHIYKETDIPLYRTELKEKGYILLRNVLPQSKVLTATSVVDDYLVANHYITKENEKEQLLKNEGILLSGFRPVTHHEKFLDVMEGAELKALFDKLFEEESYTLETKWVRVLGPKEYTDAHSDLYRFKKLGLPLYTCWIPLMDQGLKEGTLGICQDSFKLNYEEDMYEQLELPKEFLDMIDESTWLYNEYKVGDVVIFDIRMIHGSFRNDSNKFRKNTDTRWLPKSLATKSIKI